MKPTSPTVLVQIHTDLKQLASDINAEHTAVADLMGEALDHARRAGDSLIRAKNAMPFGRFGAWIKSNCRFSERTARNYMLVSRNWSVIEERQRVAEVDSVREAVRILAMESDVDVPFVLPPIGQMQLGIIATHRELTEWTYIVVEAVGEHWIRAAIANDTLTYDRRGWRRDTFRHWLRTLDLEPEFWDSVEWLPTRPVAPTNNVLISELPWKYEEAVA